jgi:hypothetical protein
VTEKEIHKAERLKEMLTFLNNLRESGKTNMFGATLYLQAKFEELDTEYKARQILLYWMATYDERVTTR